VFIGCLSFLSADEWAWLKARLLQRFTHARVERELPRTAVFAGKPTVKK